MKTGRQNRLSSVEEFSKAPSLQGSLDLLLTGSTGGKRSDWFALNGKRQKVLPVTFYLLFPNVSYGPFAKWTYAINPTGNVPSDMPSKINQVWLQPPNPIAPLLPGNLERIILLPVSSPA